MFAEMESAVNPHLIKYKKGGGSYRKIEFSSFQNPSQREKSLTSC